MIRYMKGWWRSINKRTLFQASATLPGATNQAGFNPLSGSETIYSPLLKQVFQSADISGFANATFKLAIAIGGILAVLRILCGGVLYMTTEELGKKKDAKVILRDAVIGLLLLLGVYLILNQINPDIVSFKILNSTFPSN